MFLLLLLYQPYEASLTVVAKLLYVFQWEETFREGELLQQFDGLLLANFISFVNLSTFAVVVNGLRCHSLREKGSEFRQLPDVSSV
ncbi:hypothetical protein M5K25_008878 [Dendrobium thyrsiflorum]|uniref:Uncharacterized protein n=1 Tax=Dendrobium thyrsiflorum TaxID=117978 RepID=A0ABD0VGI9_DENTH